jgi:hypothetical protein
MASCKDITNQQENRRILGLKAFITRVCYKPFSSKTACFLS